MFFICLIFRITVLGGVFPRFKESFAFMKETTKIKGENSIFIDPNNNKKEKKNFFCKVEKKCDTYNKDFHYQ